MPASGPPTRGARGWNMRCIQRAKPVPGTAPELAYSHDARQRQGLVTTQGNKASTLAAQMKSLIEMPPTEWVLKRAVQRL